MQQPQQLSVLTMGFSPAAAVATWRLATSKMFQCSTYWPVESVIFDSEVYGQQVYKPQHFDLNNSNQINQLPGKSFNVVILVVPTIKDVVRMCRRSQSVLSKNTLVLVDISGGIAPLQRLVRTNSDSSIQVAGMICDVDAEFSTKSGNEWTVIHRKTANSSSSAKLITMEPNSNLAKTISALETAWSATGLPATHSRSASSFGEVQWQRTIAVVAFESLTVASDFPSPEKLASSLIAKPIIEGLVGESAMVAQASGIKGSPSRNQMVSRGVKLARRAPPSFEIEGASRSYYDAYRQTPLALDFLVLSPISLSDESPKGTATPYSESSYAYMSRLLESNNNEYQSPSFQRVDAAAASHGASAKVDPASIAELNQRQDAIAAQQAQLSSLETELKAREARCNQAFEESRVQQEQQQQRSAELESQTAQQQRRLQSFEELNERSEKSRVREEQFSEMERKTVSKERGLRQRELELINREQALIARESESLNGAVAAGASGVANGAGAAGGPGMTNGAAAGPGGPGGPGINNSRTRSVSGDDLTKTPGLSSPTNMQNPTTPGGTVYSRFDPRAPPVNNSTNPIAQSNYNNANGAAGPGGTPMVPNGHFYANGSQTPINRSRSSQFGPMPNGMMPNNGNGYAPEQMIPRPGSRAQLAGAAHPMSMQPQYYGQPMNGMMQGGTPGMNGIPAQRRRQSRRLSTDDGDAMNRRRQQSMPNNLYSNPAATANSTSFSQSFQLDGVMGAATDRYHFVSRARTKQRDSKSSSDEEAYNSSRKFSHGGPPGSNGSVSGVPASSAASYAGSVTNMALDVGGAYPDATSRSFNPGDLSGNGMSNGIAQRKSVGGINKMAHSATGKSLLPSTIVTGGSTDFSGFNFGDNLDGQANSGGSTGSNNSSSSGSNGTPSRSRSGTPPTPQGTMDPSVLMPDQKWTAPSNAVPFNLS